MCSRKLVAVIIAGAAAASAWSQVEQGLAWDYPGDAGISSHPSVIFVEDFEAPDIDTLADNWDELQRRQYMTFTNDTPPGSSGRQALSAPGNSDGPGLYRRLLPGYERLYLRVYAKFDAACSQVHHFTSLGGSNPVTRYPWPRAGQKPNGSDHFSTAVEPHEDWQWDYYTVWPGMGCWGPDTSSQCHGNSFLWQAPKPRAERGTWFSLELMMKMNTPVSASNGEQTFWINGQPWGQLGPGFPTMTRPVDKWRPDPGGAPFPGFQWRTANELLINYLWLYNYTDTDPDCRVSFDHVVVATDYIGPMRPTTGP